MFRLRYPHLLPLRGWLTPVSSRCPSPDLSFTQCFPKSLTDQSHYCLSPELPFHSWALNLVWEDKRGSRKPPPERTASGIWSRIWQNLGECLLLTIQFPCLHLKKKKKILWCPVPSLVFPDKRRALRSTVCLKGLLLLLLLSRFRRVRLCATPETAAHQAPLSLGFSRQEYESGLPFPSPMHESEKWK